MKILITLFAISGISINSLAIFIITSNRILREDVTARLMVSSAVGDLGSSLFYIGVTAIMVWLDSTPLPPWLAKCQSFSQRIFLQYSSANLCLIAVVKCIVICRPFTHRVILSDRKVGLALTCVWIYSIFYGFIQHENRQFYLFENLGSMYYDPRTYMVISTATVDDQFFFFMLSRINLIQFLLAFLSIVISYSIIFKTILKHNRQISTVNQPSENTNIARDFLRSVRGAKNMFIVTLVYFIAYAPFITAFILGADNTIRQQCVWIMLLHTMTSSLLFIVLHTDVRDAVKKDFRKCWNRMFGRNANQTETESRSDNIILRF